MITEWDVYLITRLDDAQSMLSTVSVVLTLLAVGTGVGLLIVWLDLTDGTKQQQSGRQVLSTIRRWAVALTLLALLFSAIRVAVPSTREMCAIKVIPLLVNSGDLQGLGGGVVKLAREWVEELRPKKREAEKKTGTEDQF